MTHPTDFRSLCAELERIADDYHPVGIGESELALEEMRGAVTELAERARAALSAAPQQGAPAMPASVESLPEQQRRWYTLGWSAALSLTRYGAQAVPVAVAERLPGKGDCDADGRCWFFSNRFATWSLESPPVARTRGIGRFHWLPHWALPLPEAQPSTHPKP